MLHGNIKSNLTDILGKISAQLPHGLEEYPPHSHCIVLVETNLSMLLLSPFTQWMINVLIRCDTYADILELLWEYLPLISLPLTILLVSEKRSDS